MRIVLNFCRFLMNLSTCEKHALKRLKKLRKACANNSDP